MASLEERIAKVEARNEEKEKDKAWEISFTRKAILVALTYLAIGLYLQTVGIADPWINSVVPSIGFTLSTLSLPLFKKLWLKYIHKG